MKRGYEYKVNEEGAYGGTKLKCIESKANNCVGCYFRPSQCNTIICNPKARKDNKSVIFVIAVEE